jgi:hypothetical protein
VPRLIHFGDSEFIGFRGNNSDRSAGKAPKHSH